MEYIKGQIKEQSKFKKMFIIGIICLFLCFWVGVGILVARVIMINKEANAEHERLQAEHARAVMANNPIGYRR